MGSQHTTARLYSAILGSGYGCSGRGGSRAAHDQGARPTMEAGPNELHMVTGGVAGCGVAVIQVRRFGFPASDGTAATSQVSMASTTEPTNLKKEEEEEDSKPAVDDEDTGAQIAPIIKLQEVVVSTGEENEDVLLGLF
ncbi:hypothetical protein OROHE_002731 [Orobanche hederae]